MNGIAMLMIGLAAGIAAGLGVGFAWAKNVIGGKYAAASGKAEQILANADREAEAKKKEKILEAKEEAHRIVNEAEQENRKRQSENDKIKQKLSTREETLEKRAQNLENREEKLRQEEEKIAAKLREVEDALEQEKTKLQEISGFTKDEAREHLLKLLKTELKHDQAQLIKEYQERAEEEAQSKARHILVTAIQKCAVEHTAENTVSVVELVGDEMKGRIIGKEGRNIRAFETLTGVDLVVDDTPEAVVISAFDPIRREIARRALEALVADGRIHPARIEELVEKSRTELERHVKEEGERVLFDLKMTDMHPEIVRLLGRLKFRSSYGQNVLKHSIEVSHLAGLLAAELGVSVPIARRAGLLHDIGKAVDFEIQGPHAVIGGEYAQKYKESKGVIHAIASHHFDEEPQTVEAMLIIICDTISASRPGARREELESYIQRLTNLEAIAHRFKGVDRAFAIQAGREIRIMVIPEEMDDSASVILARDVAKNIEETLTYPGQIKVNVLREARFVEYAK